MLELKGASSDGSSPTGPGVKEISLEEYCLNSPWDGDQCKCVEEGKRTRERRCLINATYKIKIKDYSNEDIITNLTYTVSSNPNQCFQYSTRYLIDIGNGLNNLYTVENSIRDSWYEPFEINIYIDYINETGCVRAAPIDNCVSVKGEC